MPDIDRRTMKAIGVAAALVVVTLFFIVTRVGGHDVVRDVDDICQGLAAAIGALIVAGGARRQRGRKRWGWGVLAAAAAAWAAGQTVWSWYEVGQGTSAPFPSPADLGFLSCTALATVGIFLLQDSRAVVGRVRALLDGMIVAGSLLDLSWKTALGVTVSSSPSFNFPMAVSIAYPLGDIVLLTMAVQIIARARSHRHRWPLVVLAAGAAALAIADSGFTYLSAIGHYHTGDLVDLGWVGGFGLIGVAGALAGRVAAKEGASAGDEAPAADRAGVGGRGGVGAGVGGKAGAPGGVVPGGVVWLPYVVMVVAGAALVVVHVLRGGTPGVVEIRVTAGVLVLVMVRQYFYVKDHQTLLAALAAREQAFAHQAFHDDLTGLPNRAALHQRVAEVLATGRPDIPAAVLFCDLDDFKIVNDTLGHSAGDELLVQISRRLRRVIRPGDFLARLGGDEFAVLTWGAADPVELAGRVLRTLDEPVEVGGRMAQVHTSVGVRTFRPGWGSAPEVLDDADSAMYAAKRDGKGVIRVYDPSLRANEVDGLDLQRDLSDALGARQIEPAFQPIVDPRTGVVRSLEVLARWKRHGVPVPPAVFVPLTERLGLMAQLTEAMLDAGLRELAAWSAELDRPDLHVSVNVSATELRPDHHLPDRVAAALAHYRIEPSRLILEVTETAVAPDEPIARQVLGELRELGCRIALDDFGVGHSSLARLHRFPIDILKLDAAIVQGSDTDPAQATILDAVTRLGENLGLEVIVEGVETASQLAHLRACPGVPLVQGYALGRPAPAAEITPLLAKGVRLAAPGMRARPNTPALLDMPARVAG